MLAFDCPSGWPQRRFRPSVVLYTAHRNPATEGRVRGRVFRQLSKTSRGHRHRRAAALSLLPAALGDEANSSGAGSVGRLLAAVVAALVLSLAGQASVTAQNIDGLYRARVGVPDQSVESREQAVRSALAQVLVRLGGPEAGGVALSLTGPLRYVQRYQYLQGPQGELALQIEADPAAVSSLLRERGLPVWGSARPQTLTWLAYEQAGRREVVAADSRTPIAEALRSAAAAYTLPIVLPKPGQRQVNYLDIAGGFDSAMQNASQDYGADAVLSAYLVPSGGGLWQARWTLVDAGERRRWRTGPDSLEAVLDAGFRHLTSIYVQRFGTESAVDSGGARLTVAGVSDLFDYARTLGYLQSLDQVTALEVVSVSGSEVVLSLQVRGGIQTFKRVLGIGSVLAVLDQPSPERGAPVTVDLGGGESAAGPGSEPQPTRRPSPVIIARLRRQGAE